jgi:hypothetical protein
MKASEQEGTKYVVLATEFITGDSFNSFKNEEKDDNQINDISTAERIYSAGKSLVGDGAKARLHRVFPKLFPGAVRLFKALFRLNRSPQSSEKRSQYDGNDSYWRNRFDNFCRVVERAEAIWIVSPDQLSGYREKFPKKPIHLLPFPECSKFDFGSIRHNSEPNEPDIDVLFSGNATPYRRVILDELKNAGLNVVEIPNTTPSIVRMQFMSRTKVGIQLSQNEFWPYTSLMRLHQHLVRGVPIVAERPSRQPDSMWECVEFVDRHVLVQSVCDIVRSGRWLSLGLEQQRRYIGSLNASKNVCKRLLSCFDF